MAEREPLRAVEGGRSLRSAALLTAAVGIVFAVLFLAALALLEQIPDYASTDAEIMRFYENSGARLMILTGLYVMPFAAIAFLWFIVALRRWIRLASSHSRRGDMFADVQLVSGVIFISLFLASAAASGSTAATVEYVGTPPSPVEARIMPSFGTTLLMVLAMRIAAIFVFATSTLARLHGVMPRWFVFSGYVVGVFLLLSVSLSPLLVLVFPIWVLVFCVLLIGRARRIPAEARLPG
jgi:hypothetical protein